MRELRTGSPVRVLMLGWEYPPRFAGGLGKACQGLAQAMSRQDAQVFFVLPTFPERKSEARLEVVGAREVLIEAGWDPERDLGRMQAQRTPQNGTWSFEVLRSDAQLFPYGAAPEGPAPESIRRAFLQSESIETLEALNAELPGAGARAEERAERRKTGAAAKPAAPKAQAPQKTEIYGRNLWSEIERFSQTVRLMADAHEVDVVHAHDWMTFPAAFEFQRRTGTPVFLHVHATEYDRTGENLNNEIFRIERDGFRQATHIFAVSRYTAGIIERLYGVNKKKISVIYNAPEEGATELLTSPDAPRKPQVIFLGRLTFQKGPDHFLKAAEIVAKTNPDARFVFCGTGDMMDQLRTQAHRLGIEQQVHFAGFVNPSAVDQILSNSKVLVMPSVSEPFGLVALEAIRNGIPVILSKQSGVKEVMPRALQVDFWDHEKLADQMSAALRLPALSRQLVNEGLGSLQRLSWESSAKDVITAYRGILGGSIYSRMVGGAHGH